MNRILTATLAGLLIIAGTAKADVPEATWQALNTSLVKQHVIPSYQRLSDASAHLAQQARTLCSVSAKPKQLEHTQAAFRRAFLAWQGIQHVRFGAVSILLRFDGYQYWPDKKNIGGKQLRQALAQANSAVDDEFFHHASVALKGFSALEKLLFTPNNLSKGSRGCQLLVGISEHTHKNSQDIYHEWQQALPNLHVFDDTSPYEDRADLTTELLKAWVEPIEAIRDNKILRPLGKNAASARWKRSEAWRSGESLNAVRANISAFEDMYQGKGKISIQSLIRQEAPAIEQNIRRALTKVNAQLTQIKEIKNTRLSDEQYKQLSALAVDLKALHQPLIQAMNALNVSLGFNSRDGD